MEKDIDENEYGYVRLKEILKIIPITRSAWYAGVKSGKYPKGFRFSHKITFYSKSDVNKLIKKIQSS